MSLTRRTHKSLQPLQENVKWTTEVVFCSPWRPRGYKWNTHYKQAGKYFPRLGFGNWFCVALATCQLLAHELTRLVFSMSIAYFMMTSIIQHSTNMEDSNRYPTSNSAQVLRASTGMRTMTTPGWNTAQHKVSGYGNFRSPYFKFGR